jgi:hypothetical protein
MNAEHERGLKIAVTIQVDADITWAELRQIASEHLERDWPEGHGISSSDVSHHLSHLGRMKPEYLRAEARRIAERNELVARVAASTGRTPEEALAGLRALFAPAT